MMSNTTVCANNSQPLFLNYISVLMLVAFVTSCTVLPDFTELYGPSAPKNRILSEQEVIQNRHISFNKEVQPVLVQRCAVCHSCNDAPCQINFTSIEGIERGASTKPVYNGARFFSQQPSRLGIDASSTAQWRKKKFTPILNERRENEQINLDNSLLYKVLTTKRAHQFTTNGRLSEEYNFGNDVNDDESFVHSQRCPNIATYTEFAQKNPQWGMPFALPPISRKEFKIIETWLEQGAKVEPQKQLSPQLQNQVTKWETFLNGNNNKQKLMSRYLYEHLFAAHLYFEDVSGKDFFTLVRSKTQPGQTIDIINTVRPYNDPAVDQFYYRIKHYARTIVDKTHIPYPLSNTRMQRYKQLFLEPDYKVTTLPSYETKLAANPFKTFAKIPAKNRYRFMLDDAKYFVSGFIKGPVCRGSIALSAIDDHFWVVFMDPEKSFISRDSEFLAKISDNLRLPSEKENSASVLSNWLTYKDSAQDYLREKAKYLNKRLPNNIGFGIEQIWDGDQRNDNAALTVYRHYDSATVLKGFVGEIPKTGWVIDYPVFERIHYLLVAGFDVYGKVGHQLSTRLYMDYLRYEAELEFLAFLPFDKRMEIHQFWYRGTKDTERLIESLKDLNFLHNTNIEFNSSDVKKEFFVKLSQHLKKAQNNRGDYINRCRFFPTECVTHGLTHHETTVVKALHEISDIGGIHTSIFPNVTFLRIKVDGSIKNDLVYSIIRNNSYLNTTSLTANKKLRVKQEDTIDIVQGFVGAYPNFFLQVDIKDITKFIEQYKKVESLETYRALVKKFGVQRSDPTFWQVSDWFYKKYQYDNPIYSGLFDLNRYKNR